MKTEDQRYLKTLVSLAAPIMIQQLFMSGLGMVDAMLVGQLGDTSIAAVALAGQVLFLLSLLYFGLSSGSAIFISQFWGKQDVQSIRMVFSLNLMLNGLLGIVFTLLAQAIPTQILGLFTTDPQVIALGSKYLQLYSLGYVFNGLSYAIYVMLRSTESVKIPMIVGAFALSFNTMLGYGLIFGKAGLPTMGIQGAALAYIISRVIELAIIVTITRFKRPYNSILPEFRIDPVLVKRYISTALPVAVNELVWALGITTFNSIYAHISTEAITATNISGTIEYLAFVPFLGLGTATAIMVGKKIGAGETEEAYRYGKKSLVISVSLAVIVCAIILLSKGFILDIYKISAAASSNAHLVITILAFAIIVKTTNFGVIVGTMRAGGDTRYILMVEFGTMWLYGVPAALISANVFRLPVYYVAAVIYIEELIKLFFILRRFLSKRWIHNLAAASE